MIEHFLVDDEATRTFGRALAPYMQAGDVIALHGGLGAGKTTFSRGLISALMEEETDVPSPTYTLVQMYDAPAFPVFHFDLYRIARADEILELGWDATDAGLALIEWPMHAGPYLPRWRLDVTLEAYRSGRRVRLEGHGEDWQTRLHELHI